MSTDNAEKDAGCVMVCTDCGHEHGGAPHGFCRCGCTYPGWEWRRVLPPAEGDAGVMA